MYLHSRRHSTSKARIFNHRYKHKTKKSKNKWISMMKQISTIWTGKFSRIHWKHSYSHQNKTQLFRHVCVELKAYLVLLFIAKKKRIFSTIFSFDLSIIFFNKKKKTYQCVYIRIYIYSIYSSKWIYVPTFQVIRMQIWSLWNLIVYECRYFVWHAFYSSSSSFQYIACNNYVDFFLNLWPTNSIDQCLFFIESLYLLFIVVLCR